MAKTIDIQVHESEKELDSIIRKSKSNLIRSRIKALLLIKRGKYKYSKDLAFKIGVSRKTIYNWLDSYKKEGLSKLCSVQSGGNNTRSLTNETIQEISRLLNDPYSTIVSYVELVNILKETTQSDVNYKTVHHHCKTKHKSKLKVSRKSHHKKDEQAVEAFKKTTKFAN